MSFLKKIFNKLGFSDEETSSEVVQTEEIDQSTKQETLKEVLETHSHDVNEPVDEEYLENLEEELIRSDLGVTLAMDFVESVRAEHEKSEIMQSMIPEKLKSFLISAFDEDTKDEAFKLKVNKETCSIYLFVGVNGVGKTTSIAKLANRFIKEGKKVLIAAGDTFRAAAEEQLRVWSDRVGADFIEMPHGSKSSAVVYKAIEKVQAGGHDVLIIDTAGRLQNKKNLMEELSKIKQVIDKNSEPDSMAETMLVLDASTGQNALEQAKSFQDICDVSSIFLSKFDGSARAGVVFSIAHNFKIPVKLVGTGEGVDDIHDFDPDQFISKYL